MRSSPISRRTLPHTGCGSGRARPSAGSSALPPASRSTRSRGRFDGRRAFIGSLDSHGLPWYRNPVFSRRRRDGSLPILDAGFAARLREGAFRIVPGVEGFAGTQVLLERERVVSPDVVIAATGYRPGLAPLVGHLGLLGLRGDPRVHGAATHPAAPRLYFTGFRNPVSGALHELRHESAAIARAVGSA